ncbi:WXG100 family type VII secretion target [Nocardia sienata]|uniref:WXG100 family type VII secretion target n=1 Tax=Nocardia sienata TaxID=248552 RepID=UPI0007A3C166|nr:WXG100 family type VII secretion target [Nocardia sienata]
MSQMKYSEGQLMAMTGDLRSSKGRLTETHEELKGYVNALAAEWESGAQEAYRLKQARWDEAHNGLLDIMERLAKTVEDGAIEMTTTDKLNASRWA